MTRHTERAEQTDLAAEVANDEGKQDQGAGEAQACTQYMRKPGHLPPSADVDWGLRARGNSHGRIRFCESQYSLRHMAQSMCLRLTTRRPRPIFLKRQMC